MRRTVILLVVLMALAGSASAQMFDPYARYVQPIASDPSPCPAFTIWGNSTSHVLKVCLTDGNVSTIQTAATTPGGSDTQVQFNDSSAFGGDAGFTYNKTTDTATLGALTLTTTINKVTITPPATGSTITIANGKTFTVNNTLTINSTDGITMTTPTTSFTAARTDAVQSFTGIQTFSSGLYTGNGAPLSIDGGASITLKNLAGFLDIRTPGNGFSFTKSDGTITWWELPAATGTLRPGADNSYKLGDSTRRPAETWGVKFCTATGVCWTTTAGAPSGACTNGALDTDTTNGKLYVCEAAVWVAK